MTDEITPPEDGEIPAVRPPKIFEQLAMMQEGAAPPPEPPKRKSTLSVILWILIGASVGIFAYAFLSGPLEKAIRKTLEKEEEVSSTQPAAPVKPRWSVPVPADAEVDASPVPSAESDILAELDKTLTAEIDAGNDGLRPLMRKASMSLLDSRYGLTDEDLKGQNPDAKGLASIYQDMFRRMGEQLGKTGNVLADIDFLTAEQGKLLEGLEKWQPLSISKIVLCQRVSGFGRYEAFTQNDFAKNSIPLILVYAELAHFKTSAESEGRFVVRLKEELSITSASGDAKELWKEHEVSVTDAASSRRNDFFIAQYLNLPKTLEPGTYNLQVKITDEADGKVAISSIPLTITAE